MRRVFGCLFFKENNLKNIKIPKDIKNLHLPIVILILIKLQNTFMMSEHKKIIYIFEHLYTSMISGLKIIQQKIKQN